MSDNWKIDYVFERRRHARCFKVLQEAIKRVIKLYKSLSLGQFIKRVATARMQLIMLIENTYKYTRGVIKSFEERLKFYEKEKKNIENMLIDAFWENGIG